MKSLLLAAFALVLSAVCLPAQDIASGNVLKTLRPLHPRLLVLDDELPAVRETIKSDPLAASLYEKMQAAAEVVLKKPALHYEIGGEEHTLLFTSREVESRVFLLAGLYRLNGDRRYAARARDEMLAAAAFPDWYPKHFLDTAEMTAALGVGYDWLYDFLTPADRATIRQAIVKKGLDAGLPNMSPGGRLEKLRNNWCQVCNGGLTLGALAIAEDESTRAAAVVSLSRPPMARIMQLFAPDGGFEEGPVYWGYATSYNVLYLAGLQTALGTDFGLSQTEGFAETGNYRMQAIGPALLNANFGDASEAVSGAPQMFWFARQFNHPEYAAHERETTLIPSLMSKRSDTWRFYILDLLWYPARHSTLSESRLPTGAKFDRIATACIRSAWGDSNAIYFAFKGGSSRASHGHLDLGSFILDAFGQRWAVDLGADSYGLPGYFGTQRWTYYRTRTEGHNTLTVDDQNEDLKADASLTAFSNNPDRSFAIADLKTAYPKTLSDWQRGIQLLNHRQVLLQDEVTPRATANLVWNFHTRATISIADNGSQAILSQGDSHLRARILSPAGVRFKTLAVHTQSPQRPTPNVQNLTIPLPPTANPVTLTVLFDSPDDQATPPTIIPLAQWTP